MPVVVHAAQPGAVLVSATVVTARPSTMPVRSAVSASLVAARLHHSSMKLADGYEQQWKGDHGEGTCEGGEPGRQEGAKGLRCGAEAISYSALITCLTRV
jgi:hypothetical protein